MSINLAIMISKGAVKRWGRLMTSTKQELVYLVRAVHRDEMPLEINVISPETLALLREAEELGYIDRSISGGWAEVEVYRVTPDGRTFAGITDTLWDIPALLLRKLFRVRLAW